MCRVRTWLAIVVVCCSGTTWAEEPNETFGQATILGPGRAVDVDDLTLGTSGDYPDTMVASLNTAGFIIAENDDGGPWARSCVGSLAIPTTIEVRSDLSCPAYPDDGFSGDHDEYGDYRRVRGYLR